MRADAKTRLIAEISRVLGKVVWECLALLSTATLMKAISN